MAFDKNLKRILVNEFIFCVIPPNILFCDCIFSFVAIATLKYTKYTEQ